MASIGNGIFGYGGFIPYTATFLNFLTYLFPALRLTALSHFQQWFIMTHDSIGLGEDGPTHQPIETLALVRATPNALVFRPADGNETTGSYIAALEFNHGPSVFSLTRQNLPQLSHSSAEKVSFGAYVVHDADDFKQLDLIYVATGSEVSLAIDSAKLQTDKKIRVVSMPSDGLFDRQSAAYRRSVILPGVPVISIESLGTLGWTRYSHLQIGMTTFGASAPYDQVIKKFGFTPAQVVESTNKYLEALDRQTKELGLKEKVGLLPTHYDVPRKLQGHLP